MRMALGEFISYLPRAIRRIIIKYYIELFFYAGMGVEPISLKTPQILTPGRWIALDRNEWLMWQPELPAVKDLHERSTCLSPA